MPVLISAFANKVVNSEPAGGILKIAKLTCPSTEMVAQATSRGIHVGVGLTMVDRHGFQGGPSACFGRLASLDDHVLQFAP
jgi:hypothetical protein